MATQTVTIKRRVKCKTGGYDEVTEEAVLIKKRTSTYLVRLKNGDIIKRKQKDVMIHG